MAQTAVKCYVYTWDELLAAAERRECVTDLQGHILCSNDRMFEERKARDYYQTSVAQAIARGREVPDAVRAEYEQRILANGLDPDHARFAAWAPAGMSKEDFLKQDTKVVSLCDKRLTQTDTRPKNANGKPFSWSYTALSAFEKCPASYAAERFYCTAPFQETEAIRWGNRVHAAGEVFVRDGVVTDLEAFKEVEKYAKLFRNLKDNGADVQPELEITLTQDMQPTGWFAKDAWFRIKLDVPVIQGSKANVFDYKTGGKIRDDQDQLKLCSASLGLIRPELETFTPKLIWTKHQTVTGCSPEVIPKAHLPAIWEDFLARVDRMQKAWQSETFPARSGPLCPWCSQYQTCAYARRR